jgi:hypothetical protein
MPPHWQQHEAIEKANDDMIKRVITLFAVTLLGGWLAQAADAPAAKPQTKPAPAADAKAVPPGARPAPRDRTDFLATYLQLTEEQKVKVRPIFDEETKKIAELRKQTSMPDDQRKTKYAELRETTNAKLKAVLTEAQWEKYSKRGQRPPTQPPGAVPVRPAPAK